MNAKEQTWAIRPEIVFLILIVLLGAALRLHQLGEQSLWYDESVSVIFTDLVNFQGQIFDTNYSTDAPLNPIVLKGWNAVVRNLFDQPIISAENDFLLRLWPCFWGIVTIAMIYLIASALLKDKKAGLIAAFLFSISPFHIHYAQELRIYSLFVFLALVSSWLMIQALEAGLRRWWVLMTLSFSLLVYAHFIGIWIICCYNLYFVLWWLAERRHFKAWVVANASNLVILIPALRIAWYLNGVTKTLKYPWYPNPTIKTTLITFKNFFAGYGPSAWAYWPLFLIMAFAFIAGLYLLLRSWKRSLFFGLLSLLPIFIGYLMWGFGSFSFYEHRVFMYCGVAALFPIATALGALPNKKTLALALLAISGLSLPLLQDYYQHRLHPIEGHRLAIWEKVDFRSAASYLEAHQEEGDLTACTSHFQYFPLGHYLGNFPSILGINEGDAEVMIQTHGSENLLRNHGLLPTAKETACAGYQRVWLLRSQGTTFEYQPTSEQIQAWFESAWRVDERHSFDGLTLTLYSRKGSGS